MGYVSAKVLSESIDIDEVIEGARADWESRQRKRRSLEKWLIKSLPFGMVAMVIIFYGLSAPHTALLLGLITPTFVGQYFAPFGWELGVLIFSALREAGWHGRLTGTVLWVLLILSVVINVAGAFIAVVSAGAGVDLQLDTVEQLLGRFGTLPATYQVVLVLLVPIGAVIPIIAKLAGEGVVKLAMGTVTLESQSDDERWLEARFMVVQSALFQAGIKAGAGAKTAGNWAAAVVSNIYREDTRQANAVSNKRVRFVEQAAQPMGFLRGNNLSGRQSDALSVPDDISNSDDVRDNTPSKDTTAMPTVRLSKKEVVAWLEQQPTDIQGMHPRAMCRVYMQQEHGFESEVGYKTFERAKQTLGLQVIERRARGVDDE